MPKQKQGELSKKRERLEALAVISIAAGDKKFGRDYIAKQLQDDHAEELLDLVQAVDLWKNETLFRFVQWCCSQIVEQKDWAHLANDPKQFNVCLDRYLAGMKTAMRLLYDMPDHRPPAIKNVAERVARLRNDHPHSSWGELSIKYKQSFNEEITP